MLGEFAEAERGHLVIAQGKVETIPICLQAFHVELLGLVRGHAGFARAPHAVALLGFREDHRRAPLVSLRRRKGSIEFAEVVASALERVDFFIGHRTRERSRFRIAVEELQAVVISILRAEGLVLAVDGLREAPQ